MTIDTLSSNAGSRLSKGTVAVGEKIGFLQKFLGYELKSAERYRRFVSLVLVDTDEPERDTRRLLSDAVRTSDILADMERFSVILMTETNSAGALSAIDRYKNRGDLGSVLRFAVVTYPSDGGGVENLIETGYRRLKSASSGPPGTVVMNG